MKKKIVATLSGLIFASAIAMEVPSIPDPSAFKLYPENIRQKAQEHELQVHRKKMHAIQEIIDSDTKELAQEKRTLKRAEVIQELENKIEESRRQLSLEQKRLYNLGYLRY